MRCNFRKKVCLVRDSLLNEFRKHRTNESKCAYKKQRNYCLKLLKKSKKNFINNCTRGGSGTAATSKMERFVITVNGWKPLAIVTKRSILNVAAVLDPPLTMLIKLIIKPFENVEA